MPTRGYLYPRTIRFHETDAAGVVYFANILVLCHEAFEASLAAAGIPLRKFFGQSDVATPIVHAEADFRRPLYCGDEIWISVLPQQTGSEMFEVHYQLIPQRLRTPDFSPPDRTLESSSPTPSPDPPSSKPHRLATAFTRHICITVETRQRQMLSPELANWIEFCQRWEMSDA